MKNITLIVFFLLMFCNINAQAWSNSGSIVNISAINSAKEKEDAEESTEGDKNLPKSIISSNAEVRTYYTDKVLKEMSKGALIDLYIEHLKVVINKIPRIGLTTKPGITMADLGIPDSADNRRLLDFENEATQAYLEKKKEFLKKILPYEDKDRIVTMILFYEQILKTLHEVNVQ